MANEKLITYNTLKGNRRSFTGDQRKDDYINQQLLTGKFGYDESTGGLIRLNNPINVSKKDQELGRRRDVPVGVSTEQIAQSYIDGTNKSEEARNAYINYGFNKTVNNPAFQTAAYFTPPGALIGAAGAATRIPSAISEFADDPSLKTGANLGLNALMMTPLGRAAGVRFSPFRDAKSFYKGFKGGLDRAKTSNLPTDRYGFTDFYNTPRLKSPINIPKPTSPFATANKFNIKIPEGLGSIDKVTGKLRPTTANLLSPAARNYMTQEFSKDLDKMASTFSKNKEAGWQKFQDEIIKLNRKEKYKPIAETRAQLLKNAENMPQRYGDMDQLPQYIKNNYQYVGFLWEKGLIDARVNKEQLNKLKDNKELVDEYADRQMKSVRGIHLDADEATKDGGTAEQMADQFLFAQPSLPQDKFELRAGRGQLGRGVYTSNAPGLADRFAGRSQGSMKSYVGDMSIVKPGELEGKSPSEIVDFFDRIGRPAKMTEPATGKTYGTLNREKDNRIDFGKAFKASIAGKEYSPNNPITSEPDLPEGFGLFDVKTQNPVAPDVRYIYQGYNTMAGDTPGQVATERVIIRPQNITPGEKYEKLEGDVFDPTKLGRSSGIRGEAADPKYFSNWDQLYKELVSGGYLPQGEKYKNFISDLANLQKQTNKYGEDQAEAINNIKNKIVNSATFVDDLMPKMKSADPFTDAVAESVYYGPGAPKELISGRQSFLDKIASKKSYNAANDYRPLSTTGISDQFSPTINYLESLNRPFTQGVSNPLVDEKITMGSTMTSLGDVYLNKTSGLRSKLSGLFNAALPDISSPPSKNPFYNISPSVLGGSPTTSGLLSTFPNRAITVEALKAKSLKDQSVKDDLEYLKQSTFTPTYVYSPSDDILGSPVRNMDVLSPPSYRQSQVRNPNTNFKKSSLASFKKRLADNAELARFYADPLNVPAPKTFLGQFEPSQVMGITEDITGKPFTNVSDLEKDVKDILNYDRLEPKEQKSRFGNIGTYSDFLNRRLDLQNALSGRGSMFNLVPSKFRDNLLEDLPTESSQGFYTAVMSDKLMEATNVGQELLNKEFPLKRKNERVGKFLDWTDQQKDFQRIFYPQQRILKKYGGPTNPPTNPYADMKKYKNGGDPPKKKPAQLQFDPTSMFNPYGDPTYSLEEYNTAITRDSTNLEEALSPGLIAQMFGMDEAILPSDYADKLGRNLLTNRVNRNMLKPYSEKELQDINYRKYGGKAMFGGNPTSSVSPMMDKILQMSMEAMIPNNIKNNSESLSYANLRNVMPALHSSDRMENGGKSMDVDYEAEGGEVVIGNIAVNKAYNGGIARQYKGSNMFKLEGPSHAKGGIGITMQTGGKAGMNYMRMGGDNETSYVFSDAIGKKGNTFADRASKFGNKLDNINTMAMGGEISDRNTAERMGPRVMSEVKDLFNEQEEYKVKNNIDQDPNRMFLGGLAAKFGATALGQLGASAGLGPGLTAAQFLPGAINVAKGLFGKAPEMNLERVVPEMQEYEDFTGLQNTYMNQQDRSLYGLRKGLEGSGATGSQIRGNLQAGLSGSQNSAGQFFSQLGQMQNQSNRQTDNLNYQREVQADQMNSQMDAMEEQFAMQNDPSRAFSQGLSQLIGTGTGMAKEGFNRKLMEQMFGAMGGGNSPTNNSPTSNSPTFTPDSQYMGGSPGLGLDTSLFGRFGGRMSRSKRLK